MLTCLCKPYALLRTVALLLVMITATTSSFAADKPDQDQDHYRLHFEVDLTRTDGFASARISVQQAAELLREVRLRSPADPGQNGQPDPCGGQWVNRAT